MSGLLGETFGLTQAEQSVVRLRVEGRDLNAIARPGTNAAQAFAREYVVFQSGRRACFAVPKTKRPDPAHG